MSGKTFYTLDRAGTLVEDARIDYQDTFSPIVELKEHIESRSGRKYQGTVIITFSTTISTF